MNAPLRVPTRIRTWLMLAPFQYRIFPAHRYVERRVLKSTSCETFLTPLQGTDLALAFEGRPMDAVQVHESIGQGNGFVVRLCLDKRIASNHFPGFGEWTIDHHELAAGQADTFHFCRRLQPCRVDDRAVFHRFADEFP